MIQEEFLCFSQAYAMDATHYFTLRTRDMCETMRRTAPFLAGYEQAGGHFADADVRAVFDWIAIRHFDIQATIAACQGTALEMLRGQHAWLMAWREACARRRV